MSESTVPHESTVRGEVNITSPTTLYTAEGRPIVVDERDAPYWLARGFMCSPQDIPTLLAEVEALADALAAPWAAYVAACQAAGHVDNAAQDTARASLELFAEACNALHLAIHRQYSPAPAGEE